MAPELNYEEFWIVWRNNGGTPTYRHASEQAARKEAERLSGHSRGEVFHVMRCVASCVNPPSVVWAEAPIASDEFEVPF